MKVENLVPEVYYKESRDFSYIGRLFEILLNYMKTNADLINASLNSENIRSMLVDLLNSTLGFESKHEYITKDLIYLASSFIRLLRKKGSLEAVIEAVQILLTSQNISSPPKVEVDNDDPFQLTIILPSELTDVILLEDLFDYILPAGWTVVINRGEEIKSDLQASMKSKDTVISYIVKDSGEINGLGNVYKTNTNAIDEPEYEFTLGVSES